MALISWPDSLPATLLLDGLSAARSSHVARTAMDAGPAKARRRCTASTKTFQGRMVLDAAQRRTLEMFYRLALADGVLRFNFTDPQTLETGEFRFTGDYTETSAEGKFEISLSLERM